MKINDDFSDEDQCQCMYTWEIFTYNFLQYQENFHQSNSPLVNPPWKVPTWNISPYVFKYSRPSLLFFFFFHYCYCYHWYYLKDCFVILFFKSAEVFTFVKICQNEFLSEERQLMKWVGILKVRIFLVAVFRERGFSKGEFDGWGRPPEIFFPRTIFFIECTYSYFSKNYQ